MRVFVLVSLVVLVSMSSSVMAMGKSDGNEDKVKSSVKKAEVEVNKETVEAKPEVKVEAKPMVKAEEAAKVEIAEPEVDKVWLTVNSTEIMQSQLDEALAGQFANMEKSGRKLTKEMKDTFRRQVADKMIREVLVEQKIAEKKIVVSDEEANGRLTEMAEQQSMTVEAFLEMAKTQGAIEPDELKRRVKMGIGFEKLMDMESAAADEKMTVTDEEVKDFYDKNIQRFTKPEQVRASHILIMTKDKDEAGKAAAKAKIDDILKQAKEGADFAVLAKEHSEDPGSKDKGGEYTFGRGRMVPEFEKAAFSLEVGGISDVVETQYGYHIIKLSEKMPGGVTPFEEAKEGIVEQMEGMNKQKFSMKYFETITKEAKIEWAEGVQAPKPPQPAARPVTPAKPKDAQEVKPAEEKK